MFKNNISGKLHKILPGGIIVKLQKKICQLDVFHNYLNKICDAFP